MKTFLKNVEGCRDGSAKTTETSRYKDGSDQARQDIQRLHKSPHPYIIFYSLLSAVLFPVISYHSLQKNSMGCKDGVTCVVFVCPALPGHCHPYMYLASVVFGTGIPTSFYIFGKCFIMCMEQGPGCCGLHS